MSVDDGEISMPACMRASRRFGLYPGPARRNAARARSTCLQQRSFLSHAQNSAGMYEMHQERKREKPGDQPVILTMYEKYLEESCRPVAKLQKGDGNGMMKI